MSWADIRAGKPKVDSRLQFVEDGLQLLVRLPAELGDAAKIDEQVTHAIARLMQLNDDVKAVLIAEPTIKATVRV